MTTLRPSHTLQLAKSTGRKVQKSQGEAHSLKFTRIDNELDIQSNHNFKATPQSQICIDIIIIVNQNATQMRSFSEPTLSRRGAKKEILKKQFSDYKSKIRFSREEQSILCLDASLEKLKSEHKLKEKNVQIKYVNTLKKVKETSKHLGCKVKVQSSGFTLQNTRDKERQRQESFNYSFNKQFNRYFKRKLVQRLDSCEAANKSLEVVMNKQVEQMAAAIKLNKKSHQYHNFTSNRMETYLRGVSTKQKKMPFSVKKEIDRTIDKIQVLRDLPSVISRKISEFVDQNGIEDRFSPSESPNKGSKNSTSEKWSQLISEYQEDIEQFEQICDFFERIQHQLLRYMPNNHLSNKINNIITQVEHSKAIRKIYDQCNTDISVLTPQKIISYLKKQEGILSCMNYIVNVIKLNISAERRKRFQNLEKVIGKYQQMTISSAKTITDKLAKLQDRQIKKCINDAIKNTNTSCRGLDPSYLQFVKQAEEQEFSSINSGKNRHIICEILKFQSLMK